MSNRIPFQKPYTCAHDLVSLLQSRGMTIADTVKAENYLSTCTANHPSTSEEVLEYRLGGIAVPLRRYWVFYRKEI